MRWSRIPVADCDERQTLDVEMEGGELHIGRTRVRSTIAGPLVAGQRYVLWMQDNNSLGTVFDMYWPLLVRGATVETVDDEAHGDPVAKLTLKDLETRIRKAAAIPEGPRAS